MMETFLPRSVSEAADRAAVMSDREAKQWEEMHPARRASAAERRRVRA